MIIELKATIDKDGQIKLEPHAPLPIGEVQLVIAYESDEEIQDELLWDAQFAATPTVAFDMLIEEAMSDLRDGKTEEFDPFNEDL